MTLANKLLRAFRDNKLVLMLLSIAVGVPSIAVGTIELVRTLR